MELGRGYGPDTVLVTDRVLLRPWRVSDAIIQRELWGERDPRVPPHRRIDDHGHPTVEELEDRIRADHPAPPLGLLAAELRGSGDVIGYCGLIENAHGPAGEPELAFELLSRWWGQGFATEVSGAVVERARSCGIPRLWATVRDWNLASRRVLEKLGFIETDRIEPDAVHGDILFTALRL